MSENLQFAKAFRRRSEWTDKDELLDVLYWGRQIISLAMGLLWGLLPLKGFVGLFLYVALSTSLGMYLAGA